MKIVIFFVLISTGAPFLRTDVSAQTARGGYVLNIETPNLQSMPPLNSEMPSEVIIGYYYFDSLRSQSYRNFDSFVAGLTNSDILRRTLKYLYEIDDYDPLLFKKYSSTSVPRDYGISGPMVWSKILKQAARVIPDTLRTLMLLHADVIARIVVTNIETKFDSSKKSSVPNQVIVTCQILDTIKGKILPSCSSGQAVKDKEHISLAGNCLQFCYSPQEDLTGSYIGDVKYTADSMVDNQGMPWVRLGMEYIAFLSLDIVGKDSLSMYYTLYPAKWHTSQGGLYPIISGVVSDPENDFGFGTNRSVSDYISSLRKRIYKLTNP